MHASYSIDPDVDRELWEVLEICDDAELEEIYNILHGDRVDPSLLPYHFIALKHSVLPDSIKLRPALGNLGKGNRESMNWRRIQD